MKEQSPLFLRSVAIIKAIPKGKVLTYAEVANLISAPGCARHISYVLSSSSRKHGLPWHRVINSQGKVSAHGNSYRQKKRLEAEGVIFHNKTLDLEEYLWKPTGKTLRSLFKGLPKHIPLSQR